MNRRSLVPGMGLSLTIRQKADALRFEAPGSSGAGKVLSHPSASITCRLLSFTRCVCHQATRCSHLKGGWAALSRAGRECGEWGVGCGGGVGGMEGGRGSVSGWMGEWVGGLGS